MNKIASNVIGGFFLACITTPLSAQNVHDEWNRLLGITDETPFDPKDCHSCHLDHNRAVDRKSNEAFDTLQQKGIPLTEDTINQVRDRIAWQVGHRQAIGQYCFSKNFHPQEFSSHGAQGEEKQVGSIVDSLHAQTKKGGQTQEHQAFIKALNIGQDHNSIPKYHYIIEYNQGILKGKIGFLIDDGTTIRCRVIQKL